MSKRKISAVDKIYQAIEEENEIYGYPIRHFVNLETKAEQLIINGYIEQFRRAGKT